MSGESFKEVCAHFGAAMYFAQVLEHGIANAMLFVDLIPRTGARWTDDEYDEYFNGHFEKTLGNLIKALKAVTVLPEDLEASLAKAKERRDHLAHRYFREVSERLVRGEHDELIEELENDRAFFEATDKALEAFVMPVMVKYGFTEERLERELAKYKEHVRGRS